MHKIALLLAFLLLPWVAVAQEQAAPEVQQQSSKNKDVSAGLSGDAFSDAVIESVLRDLKNGLESHNQRRTLALIDDNRFDGYLQFRDQLGQFFQTYESIRIHSRILQTSVEGAKGIALVEMQMEAEPENAGGSALRRDQQIRFELEQGKNGWKIVDFRPREFFTP